MIHVLLVDDHPVVLSGLLAGLGALPDVEVVGVARSLAEANERLERGGIDVALVDLRLPDGLGLSLLSAAGSGPAMIMLTSFDQPQYVSAAAARGARGFLLKTTPLTEVAEAIRLVARGGTAFSPEQISSLGGRFALSARDRDIVRLVMASRSNDEIGHELGMAAKTVESHLSRLFERSGATSRVELVLRAEREGWLVADAPPEDETAAP
ncbi:MAG: response regulator transcription factor [Chloroflexi bacterium]|nr:response regulator transcription factor [Chloroflexota bacterium]